MFALKKPAVRSTPSTPPAPLTTRQRGQHGEDEAVRFLQAKGYRLVTRNWRPGNAVRGEIDCIAWTRDERGRRVLAFVEVKARRASQSPGSDAAAPQEAVTLSKQRQIARLANSYVSFHRLHNTSCRFDVVEVWLEGKTTRCVLHRNAFDYQE